MLSSPLLTKKNRRSTPEDRVPHTNGNTLLQLTLRDDMDESFCLKYNQWRHQEGQREELAQHAIERTKCLIAKVSSMWLMMHTRLTLILFQMNLWMYMKRRQQQHRQEYCQQHHRSNMSLCHHFHAAKVRVSGHYSK